MEAADRALRCASGHSFDMSREGYVNLLPRPHRGKYDKALFQSRQIVCRSGFFDPLVRQIAGIIAEWEGSAAPLADAPGPMPDRFGAERPGGGAAERMPLRLLDAGCGEGSLLTGIRDAASAIVGRPVVAAGADIAKDGVRLAARRDPGSIWCVADLANSPFNDGSFDVVLNLLSPANASEFHRLLSAGGAFIKVMPGPDHLEPLRRHLHGRPAATDDRSEQLSERYAGLFDAAEIRRLRYSVPVDRQLLEHLIRMTPLSWRAPEERIRQLLECDKLDVTVDLSVLYARKRA
jgi:23S rRNA (guanine745-N1)-methyltransferase